MSDISLIFCHHIPKLFYKAYTYTRERYNREKYFMFLFSQNYDKQKLFFILKTERERERFLFKKYFFFLQSLHTNRIFLLKKRAVCILYIRFMRNKNKIQ